MNKEVRISEVPTVYCCDRCGLMFRTWHQPCPVAHPVGVCCHCTDEPLEDSVACGGCPSGRMYVVDGWETRYALKCDSCPEYFYGGDGLSAVYGYGARDTNAAIALLKRAGDSARVNPEIAALLEEPS